jgi:hypothetical protein
MIQMTIITRVFNFICTPTYNNYMYMYMYMYVVTVGADSCLERCTNFYSDVCIAYSPMRWAFNGKDITADDLERLNIALSPRDYTINGLWRQTLTAYNVCVPVNISCLAGEDEVLSHTIHICKQIIYIVHVHACTVIGL